MRVSIITPSFNCADTLEQAIESVLSQGCENVEHIVVDGGSTDGTVEILKKYRHLKWVSEPDGGQVDAMHKGFAMSSGEVIGNLNADDYYLPGAFAAVMPQFESGADFVVGRIQVHSEHTESVWINDPEIELSRMLKHWEPNAFCVNPVGYFYRREVQEAVPFNRDNDDKHDLEFLLETAARFELRKVDALLGVFRHVMRAKTFKQQLRPSYWNASNFAFVERILSGMNPDYRQRFRLERERGYQVRRHWTIADAVRLGRADSLMVEGEVFPLPADEAPTWDTLCGFVDYDRLATPGDWVIPVLTAGKVGSKAVCQALNDLPRSIMAAYTYHTNHINASTARETLPYVLPHGAEAAVGLALNHVLATRPGALSWKIITGVREPIATAISGLFEIHYGPIPDPHKKVEELIEYILAFPDLQFRQVLGIDLYAVPFDRAKGYTIVRNGAVAVLVYRFEQLPGIFGQAMQEFLGITGMTLPVVNASSDKPYAAQYKNLRETFRADPEFLERIYSSRYVRHFYSDEEIEVFRARWSQMPKVTRQVGETRAEPPPEHDFGLIYDVGAHSGQDTEFYLKKGFRVVAIDANPILAAAIANRFKAEVKEGRLTVLNVGIVGEPSAEPLTFYVNEQVSDWSSFIPEIAGRQGMKVQPVAVPVRTLADIVEEYGPAYYVKIDIEGYDHVALDSLIKGGRLPKYVSVENGNGGMLAALVRAGYDRFKYVQQNAMPGVRLPAPAKEGLWISHRFEFGSSGPFGEEIEDRWLSADEVRERISRLWDPDGGAKRPSYNDAVDGWFDLHARIGEGAGR